MNKDEVLEWFKTNFNKVSNDEFLISAQQEMLFKWSFKILIMAVLMLIASVFTLLLSDVIITLLVISICITCMLVSINLFFSSMLEQSVRMCFIEFIPYKTLLEVYKHYTDK